MTIPDDLKIDDVETFYREASARMEFSQYLNDAKTRALLLNSGRGLCALIRAARPELDNAIFSGNYEAAATIHREIGSLLARVKDTVALLSRQSPKVTDAVSQ